jgi:hypothetical protein
MPRPSEPSIEAFRFRGTTAALSAADAQGRRRFSGVAYSGEAIPNHWYWGNVVFDIGSTKAPDKVPALVEHESARIAGSGSMSFGADMRIEGLLSAKTPDAKFVADQADESFPWQMSVHIEPGSIDEVKAGNNVSVNGRTFAGPLTIFRNNTIREVSFCATGADANTSAEIFSRHSQGDLPMKTTDGAASQPTIESLQAEVARLTTEFAAMKASNDGLKAERDAAVKEVADARKTRVTELFKARGEEVTDEKVAPFLSMSTVQFTATIGLMGKTPARDPKLFSTDTTDTSANGDEKKTAGNALKDSAKKFAARSGVSA